jgi:antitoxin CptB
MDADIKRLRWRCRRGMQELDTLLLRYLEAHYANATEEHKQAFTEILDMQDPELWSLLTGKTIHKKQCINDVVKSLQQSVTA